MNDRDQLLEEVAGRCTLQVKPERVRRKVRLDLVDSDGEVVARAYLNLERSQKLAGAILRAVQAIT